MAVALSAGDPHWQELDLARDPRVRAVEGGAERSDSVRAGLRALRVRADERDWVLVHDAARPCLAHAELAGLIDVLREDEVGGLLAVPLVDTLKRADESGRVAQTVSREGLWRALTPQMFRFSVLIRALNEAENNRAAVTDEAQAVELLGLRPRLVAGSPDNIKITLPEDVARAERILQARS